MFNPFKAFNTCVEECKTTIEAEVTKLEEKSERYTRIMNKRIKRNKTHTVKRATLAEVKAMRVEALK